jgi:ankyrin repeat protein
MLLNAGADIEVALSNGDRPLHVALINEQQDSAIFLINQGADITARASRDRTPLHICSHYSLCLAARVLLDRGVSTEDIDEETWTPLCCSVSTYIADILIAYGANVNYKDKDNCSPLHQAIAKRCYGLVEVLLMNGAEIDVRTTDDGLTAMERAMDIPHRENARRFVRLLKSYRKRTLILREIEEGHAEKKFVEEEENKGEDLDKIGETEETKGKDLDKTGEEEENKGKNLDKIAEKEESGDEGDDVGGRSVVV